MAVDVLQRAIEESGVPVAEVCWRMGWIERVDGRDRATSTRLKRVLGLVAWKGGDGHESYSTSVSEETAIQIARALHLYPRDIGL